MGKRNLITIFFLLTVTILSFSNQKKLNPSELPEKYRKWLEEEVVYIITPTERDVFLQLSSDRERNFFIEAFWKQRDPNPNTPENEFKEEHYRRLNYANRFFGRGTPTPGWRTDMGRIYIILGEPKTIERYENLTEVYPTIVWFYQGMSKYGLPDSFNLVFFKKYGAGDYQLYSPIKDGPQSLLVHYLGDPKDYLAAYQQLRTIQPELAHVSLSLLPGEPLHGITPTVASDLLLANIETKPQKAIKDTYAEKLLRYKDIIEVEYTANYIDSESLIRIIRDPSGLYYFHYFIEPERLSVSATDDTYFTTLELTGMVTTVQGKTVYQFQRNIPIRFDEKERKKIGNKPFRLQGAFPLIEGDFQFSLLLKNKISKEFSSFETKVSVPPTESPNNQDALILAYTAKEKPDKSILTKPFQVGELVLYPASRNSFGSQEKLYLFFPFPQPFSEGEVVLTLYSAGDKQIWSRNKPLAAYQNVNILEIINLKSLPPAYYQLKLQILSPNNDLLWEGKVQFSLSSQPTLPRPFIYSEPIHPPHSAMADFILGTQLVKTGQLQRAEQFLKNAFLKNKKSIVFAEGWARWLLDHQKYNDVVEVLKPFKETQSKTHRFLLVLGQAYQKLGQHEEAITCYSNYLEKEGTHIQALNAIGQCYLTLGQKENAIKIFKKSLELAPDQPQIQRILNSLEKK